jgi:acetyl/propionyl-CoA carboxylase alpha subunit
MCAAALRVVAAAGYDNIGTVEFLVDSHGADTRFYFLEMNTRLQVEHPITEVCLGVDLVQGQIHIAAGHQLPWRQADLVPRGHAIECRVYAEDPAHDFLPQAGRLLRYREPSGAGIRVDTGVAERSDVPVQYDPLLAKLITYGATRDWARRRAVEALGRYVILGVRTNTGFMRRILEHPRFVAGDADTGFLATERDALFEPSSPDSLAATLAAAGATNLAAHATSSTMPRADRDPWTTLRDWR